MNHTIEKAIDELVEALREHSNYQMTTFSLFVNCEEREVRCEYRTPEQLKESGISMRNLKGQFIK